MNPFLPRPLCFSGFGKLGASLRADKLPDLGNGNLLASLFAKGLASMGIRDALTVRLTHWIILMLPFCVLRSKATSFISQVKGLFGLVLRRCAYADVTNSVRTQILVSCHDILVLTGASLLPFSAVSPDAPPLFECEQKRDAAVSGVTFSKAICLFFGVPLLPVTPRSQTLRSVRLPPFTHICVVRKSSAIFAFSHWFLSFRTVVRDGVGASTSMPFRLYHARIVV